MNIEKQDEKSKRQIEQAVPETAKRGGGGQEPGINFSPLIHPVYSGAFFDDLDDENPDLTARPPVETACRKSVAPGQPITENRAGRMPDMITAGATNGKSGCLRTGFSLIETLLAMAIVFFLLAGAAEMLCYSFLLKQKADRHRISADLISEKIEVLKSLDPEDEALTPGIHQETIEDKDSGRSFFLTWEVSEEENLKKIKLSLYPAPFGSRPPLRACWYRSGSLGF